MAQGGNRALEPGTHRLLERMMFFSDAVFAIVLTLLVLVTASALKGSNLPSGAVSPDFASGGFGAADAAITAAEKATASAATRPDGKLNRLMIPPKEIFFSAKRVSLAEPRVIATPSCDFR